MGQAISFRKLKPLQKHWRAFIAIAACMPSVLIPAAARAADDRAGLLVQLFINACIPNMANPDGVRSWAASKHLAQISEPAPLEVFVGPGDKGAAWAVPTRYGNFALSLRGMTQACAVWAQAADPSEVEAAFGTIVQGVKRPGIKMRVDKDTTEDTPVGHSRALVYNLITPEAPSGFEFTMLTAEHAGGAFQASIQVARARAD